jgi:hypothetical protein
MAAVSYSDVIKPDFEFNTHKTKDAVLNAIKTIKYTEGGATRTYKALKYMNDEMFTSKNGARDDVIKIAIVMTDGSTNPGSVDDLSQEEADRRTLTEAKRARDNGIYVFAIGVGGYVKNKVNHIHFSKTKFFLTILLLLLLLLIIIIIIIVIIIITIVIMHVL